MNSFHNRPWKAIFNGRTAINGKLYSATYTGTVEDSHAEQGEEPALLYDIIKDLAEHLEKENAAMAILHSCQIFIFSPPPDGAKTPENPDSRNETQKAMA